MTAATLTLQVGQYGNQLGADLLAMLIQHDVDATGSPHGRWAACCDTSPDRSVARAVLVDTETKAVAAAQRRSDLRYAADAACVRQSGSGNNWALGYHVHAPRLLSDVMQALRRQAEAADTVDSVLMLTSLAGGTGSGVGACIAEHVRDAFPSAAVMAHVVWPFASGETSVQPLNAVLSLARVADAADAVVSLHNDDLHSIAAAMHRGRGEVSLRDLNAVAVRSLASVLASTPSCATGLPQVVQQVAPLPALRHASPRAVPLVSAAAQRFDTVAWHGVLKHARQILLTDACSEHSIDWACRTPRARTLAAHVVLRGRDADAVDARTNPLADPLVYAPLLDAPLQLDRSRVCLAGQDRQLGMLVNSTGFAARLDAVLQPGWRMYSSRAFVHQYLQHGVELQDFRDAFVQLGVTHQEYCQW